VGGADRWQGERASRRHEKFGRPPEHREVYINDIEVLGPAGELPMPVFGEKEYRKRSA